MPEEFRKRMEALLRAHDGEKAPPKQDILREDPAMATFRKQFRKLCIEVVLPALNDAASLLKKHGHDCDVESPDATETATGEKLSLYARIRIFPSGWGRAFFQDKEPPYIWVMPEETGEKARILTNAALPNHDRPPSVRELPLQDVTREVVDEDVFNVLQVILGGGG